jgi:F-type H+-transporting ATPase subunit a
MFFMTHLNKSPLDQFTIRNLLSLKADLVGNIQISLTNISLYLIITTIIIFMLYVLTTNYNIVIPNN